MTRFADGPEVEVSADIDAPIETVWALVTDLDTPARFQDEFVGGEWIDAGPALGARFVGRNQRQERQWETTSWVTAYEPPYRFGWSVSDKTNPGAVWTYRLEATDSGTRLTYHRRLGPGPSGVTAIIERHPDREEEIIARRDETHRANMAAVVEGIKALAESAG